MIRLFRWRRKKKLPAAYPLYALNVGVFFLALHIGLPSYINSSFLSNFLSEHVVGLVYTAAAIVTFFGLIAMPAFLRRWGNYWLTITLLILELLALTGLAIWGHWAPLILFMVMHLVLVTLLRFNFDIFLESLSMDSDTGHIRGVFNTIINSAWIVSPLIAGLILASGDFWKVYVLSAGALVMVLIIIAMRFRTFKDADYDKVTPIQTFAQVRKNKDIFNVFMANLWLYIFYGWMVIYTPLYLYEHIGFDWGQIGFIFTIMLLPFVLVELPLGSIADKRLGEKEILTAGFVVLGVTTIGLSFIGYHTVAMWAVALFMTRVGASAVEIMVESYFFKQIDGTDTHIISFFRLARSVSLIGAPVLASIVLYFVDFRYLFLVLGIIMFFGVKFSLALKDTK